MTKKYLRKNEFRMDNNPKHFGIKKQPHPAYITARYGHLYKANTITHSQETSTGQKTFDVFENPDKLSKDKNRKTRISPPFWQKDTLFSDNTLSNFRFSKKSKKRIKKYNKKFN